MKEPLMTIYRKSMSIIVSAVAGIALLWDASAATAAMPTPQRKPSVTRSKSAGKPAPPKSAAAGPQDKNTSTADVSSGEKALPAQDVDEGTPLPPYARGARVGTGEMRTYTIGEEDTLLDVARHFSLGYVELRAANPDIDPWSPLPGEIIVIPTFKLLPRARQEGIVVNLGEMRLYYFRGAGTAPLSYPLGIGREGLETPTGETHISRKMAGPTWFPTKRMREEKTWLPSAVSPGNANPLGTHALYLGFPEVLIHGSNKPWGIGRRVSSGCMRMYPEDIVTMYSITPVSTRVTIVNQPIKVGWVGDGLYLEANPSMTQSDAIEIGGTHAIKGLNEGIRKNIIETAGDKASRIDWTTAQRVVKERRGYPVLIATMKDETQESSSYRSPSEYN